MIRRTRPTGLNAYPGDKKNLPHGIREYYNIYYSIANGGGSPVHAILNWCQKLDTTDLNEALNAAQNPSRIPSISEFGKSTPRQLSKFETKIVRALIEGDFKSAELEARNEQPRGNRSYTYYAAAILLARNGGEPADLDVCIERGWVEPRNDDAEEETNEPSKREQYLKEHYGNEDEDTEDTTGMSEGEQFWKSRIESNGESETESTTDEQDESESKTDTPSIYSTRTQETESCSVCECEITDSNPITITKLMGEYTVCGDECAKKQVKGGDYNE